MTSSLLCCLTTTGQPETQNISPGGHTNGHADLGGVGNSYGDDKDDGVELSDFSGNVAVDENDYDYRQIILITGE